MIMYLKHTLEKKIESLRVLLKRDQACFAFVGQAVTNSIVQPLYPPLATSLFPTNPIDAFSDIGTKNTFNLLRFCYLGVRGGMRYRYYSNQDSFAPPTVVKFKRTTNFGIVSETLSAVSVKAIANASGAIVQSAIHGGIEYEIPYKESQLFDFPCTVKTNVPFDMSPSRSGATITSVGNTGDKIFMCSIAEDFNFLRFQGGNVYRVKNN